MSGLETTYLSTLRSEEQLDLLDEIDKLRLSGISDHVSLPQIAVCGDQSSGKSSCLEAISGVPFPRKDTLCTRFATELILRKNATEKVDVNIVPGQHRSAEEKQDLANFKYTLESFEDLPALIESAKRVLGLEKPGSGCTSDILRIEVSGPSRPHLTVVDLPGLIHGKNDNEDDENVEEVVSRLVDSYMRRPRTIILAVVSAQNDRALQAVLKRAKEVDPNGKRTMGLITKPDTLFVDSESEKEYVRLALNDLTPFRLGWHVLRNRDFNTRDATTYERDRIEEAFFSQGVWKNLPSNILGASKLRERLSKVLLEHIQSELPALLNEIQVSLEESREALVKFGDHRSSLEEQRIYLMKHSLQFTTICKASCDGIYQDSFFEGAARAESGTRKFRAVVQNANLSFAETIRTKGGLISLRGDGAEGKSKGALLWVRDTLVSSRGRELPGTFSPMLIGDLFRAQSEPWEAIAKSHIRTVWVRARTHVEDILSSLMNLDICTVLLKHCVDPLMQRMLEQATTGLDCLFRDRQTHAITYNHYFTENVQNIAQARDEKRFLEVLQRMLPVNSSADGRTVPFDLSAVAAMMSKNVPDMDTRASVDLLDHLEAYYKVAMKTFIDNVAVQIVEASIIGILPNLFNPLMVAQMPSELIAKIASESQEDRSRRELLERKACVLEEGMRICEQYTRSHILDNDDTNAAPSMVPGPDSHPSSPASLHALSLPDIKFEQPMSIADSEKAGGEIHHGALERIFLETVADLVFPSIQPVVDSPSASKTKKAKKIKAKPPKKGESSL